MMRRTFAGYGEALSYLDRFQFHGFRLGLDRIAAVCEALGHPERAYPCVHVAGTNGKGSVCAMVSSVLSAAGYRVGLYTSPHLSSLRERFRIDGETISEARLADLIGRLRGLVERGFDLSYFEYTTAAAFTWFAEERVDLAVLETGLGGRLDATNVVMPLACAVTNVALDHQRYLGRTLAAIAREKAGIIKPGRPVVSGVRGAGRAVIRERCLEVAAPLRELGVACRARRWKGRGLHYGGERWQLPRLELALAGDHQVANAGVALGVCESLEGEGLRIPEEAVRTGLRSTKWPGRAEWLAGPRRVFLDGAHNMDGVRSLKRLLASCGTALAIRTGDPSTRPTLLFGCSDEGGDKDFRGMLSALRPFFGSVIITEPPGPRAPVTVERWREGGIGATAVLEPDWSRALGLALDGCGPWQTLCVTGSLYLVGAVREDLLERGYATATS